ncbi:MAG: ribonuclease III [Dehalococcoidia bacterium]|nr:ribonuclease III [Dehalococcoidia bacterium]MCA9843036.1 ribonuclease III [Dehalococcoidia bacterium]MCA9853479.1 ribonuclease III [Dehalococcoidia bacterium]
MVELASLPAPALLFERLQIKPLSGELLVETLTHASYVNESDSTARSNDRLEFLGDAILGMVVANELFLALPDAGEGDLTRMRASIVRGSSLAEVARRFELGLHLILGKGEEAAGGRDRDSNLADMVEALVGAVYVEHGWRQAQALARRLLKEELADVLSSGVPLDPKSHLQHLVQARWHEQPEYVTVDDDPGDSAARFTVEVRIRGQLLGAGRGSAKREAQERAARVAIRALVERGGDGGKACT